MRRNYITILIMVVATIVTKAQVEIPDIKIEKPTFKITDEGPYSNASYVKVLIKDDKGFAMNGYVSLRDNDNKVVVTFFSDKNGIANLMLYEMKDLKSISIYDIGYPGITIPVSRLKNRISTIEVRLFGQSTSN